ncbi:MAG: dihydrolipoyl dehydrogenase [Kiritimatiellae bacterium]|nr:dihydrolipoyl dehydrogenase [Kiritimatiellia bacterium]
MESYDIAVIGAGPGGYPAAIRAAQTGARVILIEKEALGGACLNRGCIPTKTLLASAKRYRALLNAERYGLHLEGTVSLDYARMHERKNEVTTQLRNGIAQLLKANRVDLLSGTASFTDPQTLSVLQDDASTSISARRLILATGAESVMPSFLPRDPAILDSRAFLETTELPESLLVLGGGYIGCEMACLAAALGVQVTLVEMLDDILLLLDRDVRMEIRRAMKNELGIRLFTGKPLEQITALPNGTVQGICGEESLHAQRLLAAIGRKPITESLHLERAGLATNANGCLPADEVGRTTQPHIYSVGDLNGKMQLAHAATAQGLCAAEHACGLNPTPASTLVPGVIFTMPEAAIVGVNTSQENAKETLRTAKIHFRGLGKALAEGETTGFVKWIEDVKTRRLIGAQAVGAHATDLIAEAVLAIQTGLCAADITSAIHGHPTLSESWMEAAHILEDKPVHAAPIQKKQ